MHERYRGTVLAIVAGALIAAAPVPAGVVEKLTDVVDVRFLSPSWRGDGTELYQVATIDPLGTNPGHAPQAFRWTFPGGAVEQLTSYPTGVVALAVDDAAASAALVAEIDPFGTNPDLGPELFLADGDLVPLAQLTTMPAGVILDAPHIARDGSRIVFVSDGDPLGANADGGFEAFVVDADGSNLTQVTSGAADAHVGAAWIDDDGSRVGFVNDDLELYAVQADGTGLTQLSPPGDRVLDVGFSSSIIVYAAIGAVTTELYLTSWAATGPLFLQDGDEPSVTANGQFIFYTSIVGSVPEVFRRQPAGNVTRLTFSSGAPVRNTHVLAAGSGARVRFLSDEPVTGNLDASRETFAVEGTGTGLELLTQTVFGPRPTQPKLAPDGAGVIWVDGFATGPVMRLEPDDEAPQPATPSQDAFNPVATADLSTVVFASYEDLTGDNSCGSQQLFAWDGATVAQLTPDTCDFSDHPAVSADGGVVVFQSTGSFAPFTGGSELFAVAATGGAIVRITADGDGLEKRPRVDAAGTWAVYQSETDDDGMNPDGDVDVFRARTDGSLVERITSAAGRSSIEPDVTADGSLVVFSSEADLVGTNADHNYEIFLYEPATASFTQLTDTTTGDSVSPHLSPSGDWVAFHSSAGFFEPVELPFNELFRLELATGTIERAQGLTRRVAGRTWSWRDEFSIDDAGRVAFAADGETTGRNPDGSREIWLADFDAPTEFEIDRDAPAVVSWLPAPQPVRYDLIRGDVASLALDGGTVSLGTVHCVEDDSTDASTANSQDPDQPAPGQAFFYVFRGPQGTLGGPGSWGQGTGGLERVAASGACSD